jgi:hypothetical protein
VKPGESGGLARTGDPTEVFRDGTADAGLAREGDRHAPLAAMDRLQLGEDVVARPGAVPTHVDPGGLCRGWYRSEVASRHGAQVRITRHETGASHDIAYRGDDLGPAPMASADRAGGLECNTVESGLIRTE